MSTLATPLPPQAAYTDEPVFRLSVEQYHDLIDRGKLTPDDPVELLEGILVFRLPRKSPHATAVRLCRRAIAPMLGPGYFYDSEQPITLSDGEPEPDGIVIRGTIEDHEARHPGPADVSLVIEVADTTLARDRGIKLRSYARAGIPQYWIVNLIDRQVEVFTEPDPAAAPEPTYRRREILSGEALLPLKIGDQFAGEIAAASLFPQA